MLKQHFLVFVAAGAIAMAAPFAVAQDSPTNNQSSQPSQERAKGHHGHRDPAQRTQKLTKHLNLTSDQQTKVQEIFQSEQSQMQSLHQDSSLSQQDRRAKMMDSARTQTHKCARFSTRTNRKSGTTCRPSVNNGCKNTIPRVPTSQFPHLSNNARKGAASRLLVNSK